MYKTLLLRSFVLLTASVVLVSLLVAQNVRPVQSPARPQPSRIAAIFIPDREQCVQQTEQLFAATLQELRSADTHPNLDVIRGSMRTSIHYGSSQGFELVFLTQGDQPVVVASFSCAVDVSDFRGSFRVFALQNGQYAVAARSEDYPVLAQADIDGHPISMGYVTLHPVASIGSVAQLITRWVRSGGAPAPFSLAVWNWDGQTLKPVWNKVEITHSSSEILGPLILIQTIEPDQSEASSAQVYRASGNQVSFDGPLDRHLLERYLTTNVLKPQTPYEFGTIAQLLQEFGEAQKALSYYDQALAADTTQSSDYFYYVVADLQERLGHPEAAMDALNHYRSRNANHLTPEAQSDIEQRVQVLRRKTESPR